MVRIPEQPQLTGADPQLVASLVPILTQMAMEINRSYPKDEALALLWFMTAQSDDHPHERIFQIIHAQDGAYATGSTAIPYDDTIPQKTEGTEFESITITPKHSGHIIKVEVVLIASVAVADELIVALFLDDDADALAVAVAEGAGANREMMVSFNYFHTSTGTDAITFKVRAGTPGAKAVYYNGASGSRRMGGKSGSSLTATEIGRQT